MRGAPATSGAMTKLKTEIRKATERTETKERAMAVMERDKAEAAMMVVREAANQDPPVAVGTAAEVVTRAAMMLQGRATTGTMKKELGAAMKAGVKATAIAVETAAAVAGETAAAVAVEAAAAVERAAGVAARTGMMLQRTAETGKK